MPIEGGGGVNTLSTSDEEGRLGGTGESSSSKSVDNLDLVACRFLSQDCRIS